MINYSGINRLCPKSRCFFRTRTRMRTRTQRCGTRTHRTLWIFECEYEYRHTPKYEHDEYSPLVDGQ